MELKTITLLSMEEYEKHRNIILKTSWWWLKTPYPKYDKCVRAVGRNGDLGFDTCYVSGAGVRPFCIFNLESSNPLFWHKPEALVGSKIQYGKYKWTILNTENGELHALCDEFIAYSCFDKNTNIWEESELKVWLETEGLKLITV